MDAPELASLRRRYGGGALDLADLAADPVTQFRRWLADAAAAGLAEPNAMVLCTVSAAGQPSGRTVLLKGLDERGFVWFTSYDSRKARDLDAVPRCALVFPWHPLERQVRVEGGTQRVTRAETEAYFATRPRESRLGAWASAQSAVVASRSVLDEAYAAAARRWPEDADIPAPPHWGGYRLVPATVEFWQGRPGRLHDRLRYRREESDWLVERLAP